MLVFDLNLPAHTPHTLSYVSFHALTDSVCVGCVPPWLNGESVAKVRWLEMARTPLTLF